MLDNPTFTPPSSASPKAPHSARSVQSSRIEKRMSRQLSDLASMQASAYGSSKQSSSRPTSPYIDQDNRAARSRGYGGMSPQRDLTHPQQTPSAVRSTEYSISSRYAVPPRSATAPSETPQTARFVSHRPSPSNDSSITNSSILPVDKNLIRVIFDNGRTSVVSIEGA